MGRTKPWTHRQSGHSISTLINTLAHQLISARCFPHQFELDRLSRFGKLDKTLAERLSRDWTIADMKRGWTKVFAFQ
jgi:hypothetical protein